MCIVYNMPISLEKSFASSDKSKFWSIKNGDITPQDIYKSSGKKRWFDCGDCNHSFEIALSCVSYHNQWCPHCSGKRLCNEEECDACYKKSFA